MTMIPTAWVRGVLTPSSPHGPEEWDADLCYGEDQPEGDGWKPLYSESALAAAEARGRAAGEADMRERAAKIVNGQMLGQSRSRRNELMRLIVDMIRLLPLSAPAKQEEPHD